MKNALILHGSPSKKGYYNPDRDSQSNAHWIPWLQHQLLIRDIVTQTPELPRPYDPVYADWLEVFKQFYVSEETILVGQSCGAGFLVRWLSETEVKVKKLMLVAPWLDPDGSLQNDFFKFEIIPHLHLKADEIHVLFSVDDDKHILETVSMLKKSFEQATYHAFEHHGHFLHRDMHTRKFPELLDIVLGG